MIFKKVEIEKKIWREVSDVNIVLGAEHQLLRYHNKLAKRWKRERFDFLIFNIYDTYGFYLDQISHIRNHYVQIFVLDYLGKKEDTEVIANFFKCVINLYNQLFLSVEDKRLYVFLENLVCDNFLVIEDKFKFFNLKNLEV